MRPTPSRLKSLCPGIDDALIESHLSRLEDPYFEFFGEEAVAEHLSALSRLSGGNPVEIIFSASGSSLADCTILSFDYPFVFSVITGLLTATGFDTQAGRIFTYRATSDFQRMQPPQWKSVRRVDSLHTLNRRRRIIDHFSGFLPNDFSREDWRDLLTRELRSVVAAFETGDPEAVASGRRHVNEMVAARLADIHADAPALYPVQIDVDNSSSSSATRLTVLTQDTPAFLYSLSNALSLNGVSIEYVDIGTQGGSVRDVIDIVDRKGNRLTGDADLNRVKLSVVLTKQFTYSLSKAPDPFLALMRFERLVEELVTRPDRQTFTDYLSNPLTLQDLARLLGASDFLWEDFVRVQYETLLPILGPEVRSRLFSGAPEATAARLAEALAAALSPEEKRRALNDFKDREIYLIDLDNILRADADFRFLSERMTALAEAVVNEAVRLGMDKLSQRFGHPRSVAGLAAPFAILGLGKMGGAALGYASDIELLFTYGDNGTTDGPEPIGNAEFFERLVEETTCLVEAKREGVFTIDLQLRPYGNDGPLACSLERFCEYYGPDGPAHAYERLALVRLRSIGGDAALGARIERIRDEIVYGSRLVDPAKIQDLRERQYREKNRPGKLNAKFSPGGLVDLEYDVQMLQVMHGKDVATLRTPRIHEALSALAQAGVLSAEEKDRLTAAYDFLRQLINGLRMLRGSALDLFLPDYDSDEYVHLARRMGYRKREGMGPDRQLRTDFDEHTAVVRAFVERHFGREALPGPAVGNVADLVLSDAIPQELYRSVLASSCFANPDRAYENLRRLAGEGRMRALFARLAVLACDILRTRPDPDMALNNWERFAAALGDPAAHFQRLLSQPMQLEILLSIFAGSQFLADTLIRNPEVLDWAIDPANLHRPRTVGFLQGELARASSAAPEYADWLDAVRRLRHREILRIATRDMILRAPVEVVTHELSVVAEATVRSSIERIIAAMRQESKLPDAIRDPGEHLAILAFGKLGGDELNYSSDIDLLAISDCRGEGDSRDGAARQFYGAVMERLVSDLSRPTREGHAFRVDLRLRPYGSASDLVQSGTGLVEYYRTKAALWETQALIKLRPIAGNLSFGYEVLERCRATLVRHFDPREIAASISAMRTKALKSVQRNPNRALDVKNGAGGIRDIEFFVQGMQLVHAMGHPDILERNTLRAVDALRAAGILTDSRAERIREDYVFMRRVEHYLQILEDRQTHAVPEAPEEVKALARRVMGSDSDGNSFMGLLTECMGRVRARFEEFLKA